MVHGRLPSFLRLEPELDQEADGHSKRWMIRLLFCPSLDRVLKLVGHANADHRRSARRRPPAPFLIIVYSLLHKYTIIVKWSRGEAKHNCGCHSFAAALPIPSFSRLQTIAA